MYNKYQALAGSVILLAILWAAPALAIRCGNDLIREDDSSFDVVRAIKTERCGEILAREIIGYVKKGRIRSGYPYTWENHLYPPHYLPDGEFSYSTRKVEKWLVRIRNRGGVHYCYELTFVGGILRHIDIGEKCE